MTGADLERAVQYWNFLLIRVRKISESRPDRFVLTANMELMLCGCVVSVNRAERVLEDQLAHLNEQDSGQSVLVSVVLNILDTDASLFI